MTALHETPGDDIVKAQYPGTCTRCSHPIEPGDYIEPGAATRLVDTGGRLRKTIVTGWQHTTCKHHGRRHIDLPDRPDLEDAGRFGALCPTCWTHHRGECA